MSSMFSSLIRFARSYANLKTAGACCLMMLGMAVAVQPAGAVLVDGNVQASEYGGASAYDVTFAVQGYGTVAEKGKLFLMHDGDSFQAGFIAARTICDNTFWSGHPADDNRSQGWKDAGEEHPLSKLEASDKWEVKIEDFVNNDKLELQS